jgi:hypothetical protein
VFYEVKAFVGLRPAFSAQVRFGEPGAPVVFPWCFRSVPIVFFFPILL